MDLIGLLISSSTLSMACIVGIVIAYRSNGQSSGLEAGGGIPCRPNPAATLLVQTVLYHAAAKLEKNLFEHKDLFERLQSTC